jgi:hypothetical protein
MKQPVSCNLRNHNHARLTRDYHFSQPPTLNNKYVSINLLLNSSQIIIRMFWYSVSQPMFRRKRVLSNHQEFIKKYQHVILILKRTMQFKCINNWGHF